MKLIDNIRDSWKFLSVHVAAIWAIVIGGLFADPTLIVTAWNALPVEIRDLLPPWVRYVIAFVVMFGTLYGARIISQKPKQ